MSRYNTNNPVPSNEVKDFSDNAKIVDDIVHLQEPVTKDRFGNDLKTWYGVKQDANEAITNFGYITMDSFEDGNTLTLANQSLRYEATGEYYRWDGAFPVDGKVVPPDSTPETTGGIGLGAWISVGDASLSYLQKVNFQSWKSQCKEYGYNLLSVFTPGVTLNNPTDIVLSKGDGKVYQYFGAFPHTILSSESVSDPEWKEMTLGLTKASSADITRLISEGHYIIEKNADFVVPGQIPNSYFRSERNFSEGYEYKYGGMKYQKLPFGIFEDAVTFSAIAAGRDKELPAQFLGTTTGEVVGKLGRSDVGAMYVETYAQPPLYKLTGAVYSSSGATGLSINPDVLRHNMIIMADNGTKRWFGLLKSWTSSSITVDGWFEHPSGSVSLPSGTLYVQPSGRAWAANFITTIKNDSFAESAVGLELMINLEKAGTGVDTQIVKAINNALISERIDTAYETSGLFQTGYKATQGCVESFKSISSSQSGFASTKDQISFRSINPVVNAFEVIASDGVTALLFIDAAGTITQNNPKSINSIAAQFGLNGAAGVTVRQQTGGGANSADCVMSVGKSSATNRSINAGGTINASGADYAEYMTKSERCGEIKPGDICGINSDGMLTDLFDEAVTFAIKSTNPCLVGGDDWHLEAMPKYPSEEYDNWLKEMTSQPPTKPMDDQLHNFIKAGYRYDMAQAAYDELMDSYRKETEAHNERRRYLIDNEPEKESQEYIEWSIKREMARNAVDRIAFCGQVPVNITGGIPGQYLIPIKLGNGMIGGKFITNPTYEDYMSSVGKVLKNENNNVTVIVIMH